MSILLFLLGLGSLTRLQIIVAAPHIVKTDTCPVPRHILGISAYYHDSAACLLTDGRIVAAAQEERFSRRKHDARFPVLAARYCLEEAGIGAADLECVGFYDKPLLTFERLLETHLGTAPKGLRLYWKSMSVWLNQKLWIPQEVRRELGYDVKVLFGEHHESHAASAFYPSPFEEAAILTTDGVGEWTTTSFGFGRNTELHTLGEIKFPHSLGLLYTAFTYFTGFKPNSGEYKLMGLAPYGEPKYVDRILDEIVALRAEELGLEVHDRLQRLVYVEVEVGHVRHVRHVRHALGEPLFQVSDGRHGVLDCLRHVVHARHVRAFVWVASAHRTVNECCRAVDRGGGDLGAGRAVHGVHGISEQACVGVVGSRGQEGGADNVLDGKHGVG